MFSLVAPPRFPLSPLVHNVTGEEKWSKVYLLYFLIIALWCKMCRKCLGFCHLKTLESVHMHCVLGKSLSRHFTHLDAKNSCVTKVTVKSRKTQKTCLFFFTATFRHWCIIIPSSHSSIFFQKRGKKRCERKRLFVAALTLLSMNVLRLSPAVSNRSHLVRFESLTVDTDARSALSLSLSLPLLEGNSGRVVVGGVAGSGGGALAFCQEEGGFGMRRECMNAENLCTTYYLVLLFLCVDTCFKMWCISLYLPVLNTLCSSSS